MKIIPETCCVHYKIKYPHFYSSDNNMFNSVFHIFTHLMMGLKGVKVRGMVFNTTFNSFQLYRVLLVEETGVPGENHRPAASHSQTLSHNVVTGTPCHERD